MPTNLKVNIMNNVISVNETDLAVSSFLKSIRVNFKAVNVGMSDRDNWQADEFQVTLSRGKSKIKTEFATGLGHRIVRKDCLTVRDKKDLASDNLSVTLINEADWSNDDRKLSNKLGSMFCRVFAVTPSSAGVLYGLFSDAFLGSDTHAEFCANCGYDEDSRKGLDSYLACQKIANELNAFFTYEEREKLQELLEDY